MARTVRTSMAYLIDLLRIKVNDTGDAIWTDDLELQNYLDLHRFHIRRELLQKDADEKIYYSKFGLLEGTYQDSTDGSAAWDNDATIIKIWNSGSDGATAVEPDGWILTDGIFTWTADQGDDYYLDGKSYNLNGAIAECLEQLAMDPTKAEKWSRGGVMYDHYSLMNMAKYHRNLAGIRSTTIRKTYRTE